MLVPHSGCVRDLYAEYAEIRGFAALPLAAILPIDLHADSTAQPCTTYGIYPSLTFVKELWDAGQAAFFANIGTLTQPYTRGDPGLSALGLRSHTTQGTMIQSLKLKTEGSGVLGRVVEALTTQEDPYRSKIYTVYGNRKLIQGDMIPVILGRSGVQKFGQYGRYETTLQQMTGSESDSIFADVYAQLLESTLSTTQRLSDAMAAVEVQGDYSGGTGLEQVARVMSLGRDFHGSEREVFLVGLQSFDAHSGVGMPLLSDLNADLAALHTDLTHLDLWDATAVTSISDFGRTITTNGQGTDHAWSGNTFIAGGSVKGGHIHGQYPDDLNPATSELEVGGGRGVFIPTTPWEGLWYGMAQWFGVAEDQMAEVLPNAANFPDTALHSRDEVFNS
jgi:cullin-associated NEDD8-dissociated protein 1